eukprot:Nitzschia sp. Nitz4//scaffold88_size82704//61361//62059//NITZ4_005302-RA/size82704-exonerate_est2genome-gene-0.34-mRNA-1//1//CDS//3329559524//8449//frame0
MAENAVADPTASVSDIENGVSKQRETSLIEAIADLKSSVNPERPTATPIGLFSFGLCICVLQLAHSKMVGSDAATLTGIDGVVTGFAMFYGGLLQIFTGLHEGRRNVGFTYWVFMIYGGFWMSLSFVSVLQYWSPNPGGVDPEAVAAMLFFLGIISGCFWVCTFKIHMTVCLLFTLLTSTLFILAFGVTRPSVDKVGGYFALITGGVAFWMGFADLVNAVYGPTIPYGTFNF